MLTNIIVKVAEKLAIYLFTKLFSVAADKIGQIKNKKETSVAIQDLKDAQNESDFDSAVDSLP